jgi:hypothetical protein
VGPNLFPELPYCYSCVPVAKPSSPMLFLLFLGPPVAAARALLVPWVRFVAAAGVFLGHLGATSVLLGHLAAAARALLAAWGRIIAAAARACLGNFGPISAVLGHLAVTARGLLVS